MNVKMIKAAFAGLVLSVSGFANAGLIIDIYDNGAGLTEINLSGSDTVVSGGQSGINGFWVFDNALLNLGTNNDTFSILDPLNVFSTSDGNNNNLADVYTEIGSCCSFGLRVSDHSFVINPQDVITISGRILVNKNFSDWNAGTYIYSYIGSSGAVGKTSNLSEGLTINIGEVSQVPEPSTLAIFALGIMGLASRKFKKQ